MGTRAAFFLGDFRKPDDRKWLGCIAWDGYPDGVPEIVASKSEEDFLSAIEKLSERNDFAKPTGPFPFPWMNDLCLTDETYTWHDGQVWCEFDRRFIPLALRMAMYAPDVSEQETDEKEDAIKAAYPKQDCLAIPAPGAVYDGSAPDSIIFLRAR